MNNIIKNKFLYPFLLILAILFSSLFMILNLNKDAHSIENITQIQKYPGTRWVKSNGYIGGSKEENENLTKDIELIEFANEIVIPELPPLPDIPLTEEDK